MIRGILTFLTSSIGAGKLISDVVLSLNETATSVALGDTDCDIVASTPASDNDIVAADYSQLGSTPFASIAISALSAGVYNDFTLDANGRANISPTGVSKFGTRLGWDTDGSFGGSWISSKLPAAVLSAL